MRDTKKEEMRNVLFREGHPIEKLQRVGLASLTVEGIPPGRYRVLDAKEVVALKKIPPHQEPRKEKENKTQRYRDRIEE